jgi:hypothetical protein
MHLSLDVKINKFIFSMWFTSKKKIKALQGGTLGGPLKRCKKIFLFFPMRLHGGGLIRT